MGCRENLLQSADTGKKKTTGSISSKTAAEIKGRHFLFDAAKNYCSAITELSDALTQENLQSEGLSSLSAFLQDYKKQTKFDSLCRQTAELDASLKKLTFRMELSGNKLTLQEDYQDFDVKEEMRKRCGFSPSSKKSEMKSPFTNLLELEDFEGLILSMLKQQQKDIFQKLEAF